MTTELFIAFIIISEILSALIYWKMQKKCYNLEWQLNAAWDKIHALQSAEYHNQKSMTTPALTDADALADLNGTPRPDWPFKPNNGPTSPNDARDAALSH